MTKPSTVRAIRGVRDILPPESALWNWFEQQARQVLEVYNFREIRLPILEPTELFARSVGAETDIVSKEMYTFTDRDETRVSLRPEATASVVRAYIEHGLHTWPGLVKLYYCGPMFRRERPQKGRYRQFYQIGAEVLGTSDHPAIDAETIELLVVLLERCRLTQWALWLNSIGCPVCRPAYLARLREALETVTPRLCPDCQRRATTNPLRVLDCKVPEDQPLIDGLPKITDFLCDGCRQHLAGVEQQLALRGISYRPAPRLVRGLDYYVRTTFEITTPHLGAQNALAGGGRYDGLAEMLGGPPARGFGFALGVDRFIEVLQATGSVRVEPVLDVFLVWIDENAYAEAARLARRLRAQGFVVEVPPEEMKLRRALSLASRQHARLAVILGPDERQSGRLTVKRLADGTQQSLSEPELAALLQAERRAGSEDHAG
jgi:histidyl-tRNA synthetase